MAYTWMDPSSGMTWTVTTGDLDPDLSLTPVDQLRDALRRGLSIREAAESLGLAILLTRAAWQAEVLGEPEPTACHKCGGSGRMSPDQSETVCPACRGSGIKPVITP